MGSGALLLRVVCVFALLGVVLFVLKRTQAKSPGRRSAALQVVSSTRLSKGAALTVVRIGDRELVLGVTDSSVTMIAPAPGAAEQPAQAAMPTAPPAVASGVPHARSALATAAPVPSALAPPTALPPGVAGAVLASLRRTVPGLSGLSGLSGRVAPGPGAGVAGPPTPGAFLRAAGLVARGQTLDSTDVSDDAVAAALAGVRGTAQRLEVTTSAPPVRTLRSRLPQDDISGARRARRGSSHPAATAADGTAALASRHASRRTAARTDALRDEEHPWARSCRPSARPGDALL